MNKKTAAIAFGLTMCIFSGCAAQPASRKPAVKKGTNVTIFSVDAGEIEATVSYTGTLAACESVNVSSKVNATATAVYVKDGDYVKAGATLVDLDKTDLKLAYDQSVAMYDSAVAGYNSVVNSTTKQSTAQASSALTNAQNAYNQAKTNYDREKSLLDNNSQVKLAQQSYNDAKAAYERELNIYNTNASIISAQNAVTSAEDNYNRTKQLFDIGGASQMELDAAKSNLENAKAALANAENANAAKKTSAYSAMITAEENLKTVRTSASAAYDNAKANLDSAQAALNTARENVTLTQTANESAIENAEASVNSARAAMNIAKNNLDNTSIKAPIAGYISSKAVAVGQLVGAGTPVFSIKNTAVIDAEIQVTEAVVPTIDIGTKALVSVSSAGIKDFEGAVTMINPVKDEKTGLFTVKISMENKDSALKVGMLADIILTTASEDNVIKVPTEALISEGDEYYVYVAKGKKAIKTKVEIGITNDTYTEIVRGITGGADIIVDGKDYLSDKNNEINIIGDYLIEDDSEFEDSEDDNESEDDEE